MNQIAILYNPSSGQGRSLKQKRKIEHYLTSHGVDYRLFVTASEAHLRELAAQTAQTYPVVVGVGGDTTFNIIAAEILNLCPQPIMGMIGTGSANDIVRGLGIKDITEACRAITAWNVKKMDVGYLKIIEENGNTRHQFFLGTVSAGLGTTVNLHVAEAQQRRSVLSRINPFSRLLSGLQGIRRSFDRPDFPLTAKITTNDPRSGHPVEIKVPFSLLVFLNTPYYADGLKLTVGPANTALFDGQLDCCAIHTSSFFHTIKVGLKVIRGIHNHQKEVTLLQAPMFKVFPRNPIDIQVDGEIIPQIRHFEVSIVPGMLKVLL